MLEGVLAIAEGMNPKLIRTKLEAYAQHGKARKGEAQPGASNRRAWGPGGVHPAALWLI